MTTTAPEFGLYVGEVTHRRVRPFHHRLRYRVYMLLLDLDAAERRLSRLKWLRPGRWGLMRWSAGDYGRKGDPRPLRAQIEDHLAAAGIALEGGPIRLLTMPRILGYGFNPLSVYFCYRPDGALAALVYEVSNTFGERHSYLIARPGADAGPVRQSAPKRFFVSPFMDMGMTYDFVVRPPGDDLSVTVNVRRGDEPVLTATFAGQHRALDDRNLLGAFLSHPLLTWKVIAAIHWEAIKLLFKGARYRVRGAPPTQPVTHGTVL
ncbi:DUF1365 domain-containing protein [Brevundimonas sp.]|uniref:DUF1365 domain-containing protein n=1 Tax=Brevundimonas sp. TaxID=1871086 RepID=UPI003AF57D41